MTWHLKIVNDKTWISFDSPQETTLMDPNATLKAINDALETKDYQTANDLRTALVIWLGRKRFAPNWAQYPAADNYVHALRDMGVRHILRNAGIR